MADGVTDIAIYISHMYQISHVPGNFIGQGMFFVATATWGMSCVFLFWTEEGLDGDPKRPKVQGWNSQGPNCVWKPSGKPVDDGLSRRPSNDSNQPLSAIDQKRYWTSALEVLTPQAAGGIFRRGHVEVQ